MADITVDRLVVLIEAQTRSFETQIRKLEGQINTSSRRMTGSFKGLNTQINATGAALGRAFGIGGIGGRTGVAGAMLAAVYATKRLAGAMGDLREDAKKTGIAIDEATLGKADRFAEDFEGIMPRLRAVFGKAIGGGYSLSDLFSGRIKTELQPLIMQHSIGTRGDLGTISDAPWRQIQEDLELLDKSLNKLRDSANEAAQGMTDSVQSFTHSIIDNPRDWGSALTNMLKGVSSDIVDAGLFGSGPYAKVLGTAGPSGGGPGGLIGDAFGALMGGGREFGKPVPVEVVGVSGSGAANLLGSYTGLSGANKDQSRIDVLGMISGMSGGNSITGAPGLGGTPTAAAAAAGGAGGSGAYSALIAEAAAKYGVSPALLAAQMQAESGGNPNAVSSAGAMGLMQLMPGTAKDLGVTNPYDPRQSIMGGAQYMSQMLKMSGGDTASALARYNWGPGNFANKGGMSSLPPETASYIARILAMLPGMAGGGSVSAGRPYMVGERGPEMFVPGSAGSVVPGGGVTIIDRRVNAPPIQQRGTTFVVADHDKLMKTRYGIKPVQVGRT